MDGKVARQSGSKDAADDPAERRELRHRLHYTHGVNDADYKPPFPLTAKLDKLTITMNHPRLSPAESRSCRRNQDKAKSD